MANLEFALSKASLDESKGASATSDFTTFLLMKAAVARAKVEIKNRNDTIMEFDNKILELQTSAEILTNYAPPWMRCVSILERRAPERKSDLKITGYII